MYASYRETSALTAYDDYNISGLSVHEQTGSTLRLGSKLNESNDFALMSKLSIAITFFMR